MRSTNHDYTLTTTQTMPMTRPTLTTTTLLVKEKPMSGVLREHANALSGITGDVTDFSEE
jgi:hypothetical protein